MMPRNQTVFITVGAAAAIIVAGLAVAALTGLMPPLVALFAAAALAAWVYAIVRLIDLARSAEPLSLDCRDGEHGSCTSWCSCPCHQEP